MTTITTYVTRGKINESIHNSKCIIKDSNYNTIFSTNDDNDLVYPRSAIKIFQAIPFIKSNAYKKYKLNTKQLAISCASHCGEIEHIRVLQDWLKKIKKNKKILQCGIHNPLNLDSSNKLLLKGNKANQLHNNCAGKHLGMLSGCLMHNMNLNNYLDFNHPYQKDIRKHLEYFMECKIQNKQKGIDGCSAPQYAFPLNKIAISMIKLAKTYSGNLPFSTEIKLLLNAISKYPHLTGGLKKYDSQLMRITNGRIFAKGGAEGVILFIDKDKKIGGIIKVSDGNNRALPSSANEIFKKLNILNKNELKELSKWTNEIISNHANQKIGKIYTTIK
ncbi:asparaginase [Alphaproteobacteria bacterium]|nr:asparaginase [Alphaproteobacteria bacterium]